jgi:hypothetical protein
LSERPPKILSLGAGVQSTCVLLRSCLGDLPKLDAAVFADTGWEPSDVYRHLDWLEGFAGQHGVPVHRVSAGNLRDDLLDFVRRRREAGGRTDAAGKNIRFSLLPFRSINVDGTAGMVSRGCTAEYKIDPIEQWIRSEILNLRPRQRWPKGHVLDQWFGISSDEPLRARAPQRTAIRNVYPLLDLVWPEPSLGDAADWGRTQPFDRAACLAWLEQNFPGRDVPRSACIGCPFHSDAEWRRIKAVPGEWDDAVEVDRAVRSIAGRPSELFLHMSGRPLETVDLRTDEERGQLNMFGSDCQGMCGV